MSYNNESTISNKYELDINEVNDTGYWIFVDKNHTPEVDTQDKVITLGVILLSFQGYKMVKYCTTKRIFFF